MGNKIDMTGLVFHRLYVLSESKYKMNSSGHIHWNCLCECGNKTVVSGKSLRQGSTKSCGCLTKELRAKWNKEIWTGCRKFNSNKRHIHYERWLGIRKRCLSPSHESYKYYGGKGVTIYKPWITDFKAFADYLQENLGDLPSPTHTLDRINSNGNYEPGNLRWATKRVQRLNRSQPNPE